VYVGSVLSRTIVVTQSVSRIYLPFRQLLLQTSRTCRIALSSSSILYTTLHYRFMTVALNPHWRAS